MNVCLRASLTTILACSTLVWLVAEAQSADQQKRSDVTGRWSVVVTFDGGGGFRGTLNLKQQGEKLEGTFVRSSSDDPVTGTLKGKSVTFSVVAPGKKGTEYIEANGMLEDDTVIKGRLLTRVKGEGTDLAAGGPFVATRRPRP